MDGACAMIIIMTIITRCFRERKPGEKKNKLDGGHFAANPRDLRSVGEEKCFLPLLWAWSWKSSEQMERR